MVALDFIFKKVTQEYNKYFGLSTCEMLFSLGRSQKRKNQQT
jgi:hypothetical protein